MANIPADLFKLLGRVLDAKPVDQFRALMFLLAAAYTHVVYPNLTPAYVFPIGVGAMAWLAFGILFEVAGRLRRSRPRNRFAAMRPRLRSAHRTVTEFHSFLDNDDILRIRRITRDLAKLGIHIDPFPAYQRDAPDHTRGEVAQTLFILIQLSEDRNLSAAQQKFLPPATGDE